MSRSYPPGTLIPVYIVEDAPKAVPQNTGGYEPCDMGPSLAMDTGFEYMPQGRVMANHYDRKTIDGGLAWLFTYRTAAYSRAKLVAA